MVEHDDYLSAAQEKIERFCGLLADVDDQDACALSRAEPVMRKIKQCARDLLEFLEERRDVRALGTGSRPNPS